MKKQKQNIWVKSALGLIILIGTIFSCTESNLLDGIRDVKFKATANRVLLNEGETVVYKDSSSNVSSRVWTFEGGNIASSDQEEVSVSYPAASPSTGVGADRKNDGFSTTLMVTYEDGTTESNLFKVKVYGKVTPNFKASKIKDTIGSVIQFTDLTLDGESSFVEAKKDDTILWEFEGGIPATSTERNPSVTYEAVGKYDVKLTIKRSNPGSMGTTTRTEYIEIGAPVTPYCTTPANLVGCGNNDGEEADLTDWEILDNTGADKSVNFSVSTTRFASGTASLKHIYDEAGKPAFTDNVLKYKEVLVKVTTAADYTYSLDAYADILSAGNQEFVGEVTFEKVGGGSVTPKPFYRKAGNTWQNLTATQNLTPGDYFIQIKVWNPGFNAGLKYDLYLDNIKVVKN